MAKQTVSSLHLKSTPVTNTNRTAVEAFLVSLRGGGPLPAHHEALGQLALTLADALDGDAGRDTAALARELRIALGKLSEEVGHDDEAGQGIFGADV